MVHRHNSYPVPTLTPSQISVLTAICDTLFQAHTAEEAQAIKARLPHGSPAWQVKHLDEFVGKSYSEIPGAIDNVIAMMGRTLSTQLRGQLLTALSILSTAAGTFVMTSGHIKPFPDLTVKQREGVLQAWGTSRLSARRGLVRAFASIGMLSLYCGSQMIAEAVGYPSPDQRLLYKPLEKPKYSYGFIKVPPPEEHGQLPVVSTEILIIGSGAGGGVAASRLAKGYRTLVIDKGIYAPTGEKSRGQLEGLEELYQNGGFIASESGSISVLGASAFGGGTAINWSGSLQTQHFVREEWAREKGLNWFLSDGYTQALNAVCDRMGVSADHIKQSKANSKLLQGSRNLGYHADAIPQNTNGQEHSCGFCSFGCPYGEKQGTVETFMVDAAKQGAEFLVETKVERLLFARPNQPLPTRITAADLDNYWSSSSKTQCIGALTELGDGRRAVILASKAVVVSSGSINTPAILLRSKVRNRNIGRNLHLHPVTYVSGYFGERIDPWNGAIMTALSNECENRDGTHHGAKIEVCMSFPGGAAGGAQPWESSAEHKSRMLEYNHSLTLITLVRDRDSGRIILDDNGEPRIDYDVSPYDCASMLYGIKAAAAILLAAGAKRITTTQAGVPSYIPANEHTGVIDPKWKEWLGKVEAAGVTPGWLTNASAHQMGTCSMGTNPSSSVVDPRGAVWGTRGLYLADASVFPSASGVNPMVTTMACAYSIAGFMLEDLKPGDEEERSNSSERVMARL